MHIKPQEYGILIALAESTVNFKRAVLLWVSKSSAPVWFTDSRPHYSFPWVNPRN